MRVLQINITRNSGSTGKIIERICELMIKEDYEPYVLTCICDGEKTTDTYVMRKTNSVWSMRWLLFVSRVTGLNGYRYKRKTRKAIEWIESIQPDIIHIHNIHGDWINLKVLFNYLRRKNIPVVWTLHDCWSFTGRCSYFDRFGCEKWKTGCGACVDYKVYPTTYFFDFSKKMYADKKQMFSNLEQVYLAVPSQWMKKNVEQSFMNKYPVRIVNNGIDVDVFYPDSKIFFKEYQDKFVILGVASSWSDRKGLKDFIQLDQLINHDYYQIVLVGLNEKQLFMLPETIRGMKRTKTQDDLRRIYSQAGCYVNMSRQESFGMTTIEAMSCGTPVVAYNSTAVPEPINDKTGIVVKNNTPLEVYKAIKIIEKEKYTSEDCRKYILDNYDYRKVFHQYIEMYQDTIVGKQQIYKDKGR